jgi:photosystem II stability/assembly factor-like uncharacterized protein
MAKPVKLPRWATGGTILEPRNWRDNLAYQWLLALSILMVGNWFKRESAATGTLGLARGIFYGADFWILLSDNDFPADDHLQYGRQQPEAFIKKTAPISKALYSGLYDGTNYIAIGQSSAIIHATNPAGTWTDNSQVGSGVFFYCIDFDGTTYYVIGKSNGDLIYATDPTGTWTIRTLPTSDTVYDVKYAAGYWVAVTENGHLLYRAADPTGVWTENVSHPFGALDIHAVTHDGSKWIIGAEDITGNVLIATSADPTGTFVDKTPSALKVGSVGRRGLDADASGTIVAACENAIMYSTDSGETWDRVSIDEYGVSFSHPRSNGAGQWACVTDAVNPSDIRRTLKV